MQKKNIPLLCVITFLQGMVFYASVATLYREAAGLSMLQIGTIEAVNLALSMALEVPWGWLADRIGYRRTMIACNVLFLVTKVIFWQAEGFAGSCEPASNGFAALARRGSAASGFCAAPEAGGSVSAEGEHAGPGKRTFPGAGYDPAGAVLHACRGDNAVYDGFL